MSEETGEFYAICVPHGLEEVVARHVARMPGVSEAGVLTDGAVELRYAGPLERLRSLRVSEGVFRRLGVFLSSRNLDRMMQNLLARVDFKRWDDQEPQRDDRRFSVRVDVDPELGVRPRDFQAEMTWALQAILKARPAPEGVGRQVYVAIGPEAGWAGVSNIAPPPSDGGSPPLSVAAGVVLCADLQPGDRVLDPVCGAGALLLERALAGPAAALLGGDADGDAVKAARKRLAAASAPACVCRWDPRRLPLKSRSIDTLMSHLPSAQQAGSRQVARSLYQSLLQETRRLLGVAGRAVFLVEDGELFAELLDRQKEFAVEMRLPVRAGRFRAELFVARPVLNLL